MTGSNVILILYVSVGQGHRRAALALQQALRAEEPFPRVHCLDLLELWPSGMARLAAVLYRILIRLIPGAWALVYDRRGVKDRLDPLIRFFLRLLRKRMERLVRATNPAAVVCTQAFPCLLAAECKTRPPRKFVLAAVPTDFRVHTYWIDPRVDLYLLPSREGVESLVAGGVNPAMVRETGIPVMSGFNQTPDPVRMKRKYGLAPGLPAVLLMGGGEGSVSLERLVGILDRRAEKFQLAALTGRNRRQYNRLRALRGRLRHPLSVFGFTDLVEELMSAVEVIVTKPGGLTTAEALVKRLPLVLIDPLPGQEELNARFLRARGAAIYAGDNLQAAAAVVELLRDGELRRRVLRAMDVVRKPRAARDAAGYIISSILPRAEMG